MRSKVNFGHPKWATKFKKKIEVVYRSEMVRNAIESEFGHPKWAPAAILLIICKNKFRIYLKCPEMGPKVIIGYPKWPAAAILYNKFTK